MVDAQSREAARAGRSHPRGSVRRRRRGRVRCAVRRRVLAGVAARGLRRAQRLPAAARHVVALRAIQPEQLLRVESLPDVTDFFATLRSPVTPLLPSFWAGETLFASLTGSSDWLHAGALWTTAAALTVLVGAACDRWYFAGFSKA